MPLKFGTSGLRGLSGDLLAGAAAVHAKAFGGYLVDEEKAALGARVLIGRDLRESSLAIMREVAAGLRAAGFLAIDCGAVPTPALAAFGVARGEAAVMVTGSHIPADRNGLKFYRPDGEIDKRDEEAITALAATIVGPAKDDGDDDMAVEADVIDLYLARYRGFMAPNALAGLRIAIWEHSSVSRDLLRQIVAGFGAEAVPVGRSDGFVPVDTEAVGADIVDMLKSAARSERLDAIISADADGDRPFVADDHGRQVRGDALGLIAACHLGADCVVTPVTSSSGIDDHGFAVIRTRVGSPYVVAGMGEALKRGYRAVVGFEANGGFLTASDLTVNGASLPALPTRDALLPILCLLARIAERRNPVSTIVADLGLPASLSDRASGYDTERGEALVAALSSDDGFAGRFLDGLGSIARRETVDGARFFFEDGAMIHFRPSGNAPEMRCYAEATDPERARLILAEGLKRIAAFRGEGESRVHAGI